MSQTQADKCLEKHGFTNPLRIDIACQCEGCTGGLRYDGVNRAGDEAVLACDNCGCAYVTSTAKHFGGRDR